MKELAFTMALVLLASGCDFVFAPCTSNEKAGITITMMDSVTQGPVVADSVTVMIVDGSYADTIRFTNVRPDPVTHLPLALERPGVYDVSISATGYRSWVRNDIRVRDGRCHVETVRATARLQRLP
jgi:hypothetical protein